MPQAYIKTLIQDAEYLSSVRVISLNHVNKAKFIASTARLPTSGIPNHGIIHSWVVFFVHADRINCHPSPGKILLGFSCSLVAVIGFVCLLACLLLLLVVWFVLCETRTLPSFCNRYRILPEIIPSFRFSSFFFFRI